MDIREELKSAGTYPTGPVSAWPESRNEELQKLMNPAIQSEQKVKVGVGRMAQNLVRTAGQVATGGKVSTEVRNERFDMCKACPAFIKKSERCSECGCYMAAKTWVNARPELLCPLKKWTR